MAGELGTYGNMNQHQELFSDADQRAWLLRATREQDGWRDSPQGRATVAALIDAAMPNTPREPVSPVEFPSNDVAPDEPIWENTLNP